MKVVFEKTICDQIFEHKRAAVIAGKTIDHIWLTEREAKALINEPPKGISFPYFASWKHIHGMQLFGVNLKVEGV